MLFCLRDHSSRDHPPADQAGIHWLNCPGRGVIFGVGFAILGYCPGTAAAAFGSGAMDALMGMIGIVIGAGVFARLYPFLDRRILHWGAFPADTIAELVGVVSLFY